MNDWQKLVVKLSDENPGKPLGAILPVASKIYKKMKLNKTGAKMIDAKTTDAKTPVVKTKRAVQKARKTAKRRKH